MRIQDAKPILTNPRRYPALFSRRCRQGLSQGDSSQPSSSCLGSTKHGPRKLLTYLAAVTLALTQHPALAQYGPPASGSSSAILFTPATLSLIAGLNGPGSSGNGGLATAAELNFPIGIAYDSNGNLYIADSNNYSVRKVDTSGNIHAFAGTGSFGTTAPGANAAATSIGLGLLTGVAVDSSNNVYFGDRTNNVIWKVNTSGVITVYAGTVGSIGYTGDTAAATSATLDGPEGLAFDASGNLYFGDYHNNVVRVVRTNGNIYTFAGNGTGAGQFGTCPASYSGNGGAATAAALCSPQGVAVDRSGNVYLSSYSYNQVYVVGTNGNINLFAGTGANPGSLSATFSGDGGAATSAELWRPAGLYADPAGDIYIVDQFGGDVREVNTSGIINSVYGILSGGDVTRAVLGLSDVEANTSLLGDADGINFVTMDPEGDLIVASTDADVIFSAGSIGQYRFPQTQIFTTETTIQANATSSYYPPYLTISNPSGVTLNFTGTPQVTGPFAVVTGTGAGTCTFPGSVAPGQSCTLVMSFTPTLGGSPGTVQTGSIVITSNAGNSPTTISLSGTGTGTATVSATLTPSPLSFTSPAGVTSAAQQATLTNTGQLPIAIGSTNFYNLTGSDFAVSASTCPTGSATLAVGASCTYSITFTPPSATSYSSGFQACISTNSYGCTSFIILQGTGTAAPTATLLPTPLAFGTVVTGQTSSPMSATLSNTGSSAISISSFAITGTNPSDFAISTGANACGSTLAAGASCSVYVTFMPASVSSFSAQLTVSDTASNSPQVVALNGSGASVTAPAPLIFNPAPVAIPLASAQTLTATFQLNGFSTVLSPTARLHYGLSYSIGAVSCTGSAGSQSCSVPITFQPQYPGGRREALFLMNGTTRLATLLIYGIGEGPFAMVQPGVITNPISNSANYIYGSIVDEAGTAYIVEQQANAILAVTKTGVASTLPITGLNSPRTVGVDGAGVLYISDQKPAGPLTTYDTVQGTQGTVPFPSPAFYIQGVAVGDTGNIYETDYVNVYTIPIHGSGVAATTVINPSNIQANVLVVDSNEDIFIGGYDINEIAAGGTQTQINTVGSGTGIAVDAAQTIYATRYSATGGVAELPASGYSTYEAALDTSASPLGTSLGPDGTLYVGNYNNLDKVDRTQGVIAFGQISASASQNITLYNGGNQGLTITSIAISGSGFSFAPATSNPCTLNVAIAPGALCQVTVTLTPVHAGTFSGSLVFTNNSLNNTSSTQSIALSGSEYGIYVTASPTSLSFGNQTVGSTSATQTITLTNNGELYSATIGSITSTAPFNVTQGTCTVALAPGASCALNVSFSPTTTQAYSNVAAGLSATSSGGGPAQAVTFTLSGTGVPAAAPQAVLSPSPLAFPGTIVGSAGAALPLTLSNPGSAALTISSISVTGANAADFSQTNNCGASLAASASCTINVTFNPASASSFSAALSVADNATGSPQSASLTGTGTTPQATLSPNPLAFPSTAVGSSAASLPVTLSNPGTAALTISGISISGTNAGSFAQTNNCGASLAAAATCTITVAFTPASAGSLTASLSIADNAAGSPQAVSLAGTGTAPQAVLAPNPLAFPSTTVGVSATALPMTLSNPGNAALNITSIAVTGTSASSFGETNNCGSSLAVGATCTITVSFTPASAASLSAAITVTDNAAASPQSAAISGTGAAPLIPQAVLTPNPLAFASTTINTAATPLPMTLANPGNTPLAITSISVTGLNSSNFSETNNCGTSLAAGATCTISVGFTPTSAATLTAAISIVDNASGSPQSAGITGVGSAGTYTVNSSTPAQNVQPGAVAQFNIVVAPLGGSFNNLVTLSATGLPAGAQVSFLPSAVIPGSAGATSVMSIQTSTGLARLALPESQRQSSLPLLALLAGVPLLGLAGSLRRLRQSSRRWVLLGLTALTILPVLALSGCGGGYFGPAPQTYTVNVAGTSGALQESTTVALTVQ
jgi:hypothetical protein